MAFPASYFPGLFFALFLLAITVMSTVALSHLTNFEQIHDSPPIPTHLVDGECESITRFNETTGIIGYSWTEPMLANQRCIWIIRVDDATGYNLEIQIRFLGSNSAHHLSLIGFQHLNSTTERRVIQNNQSTKMANVSLIMVTFHSGPEQSIPPPSGFALHWTATFGENILRPSINSSDYLLNTASDGSLTYPESGNYSDNEMSFFAFIPPNFTFDFGRLVEITVIVHYLEIPPHCVDYLDIYSYNSEIVGGVHPWKYMDRICGANTTTTLITRDLLFFRFESDASAHGSGFTINYKVI